MLPLLRLPLFELICSLLTPPSLFLYPFACLIGRPPVSLSSLFRSSSRSGSRSLSFPSPYIPRLPHFPQPLVFLPLLSFTLNPNSVRSWVFEYSTRIAKLFILFNGTLFCRCAIPVMLHCQAVQCSNSR